MNDDLVGYVMGALDPHEMRIIEQASRHDPAIAAELEKIRNTLAPLDRLAIPDQSPPGDLIARTVEKLDRQSSVPENREVADFRAGLESPTSPVDPASPVEPFGGQINPDLELTFGGGETAAGFVNSGPSDGNHAGQADSSPREFELGGLSPVTRERSGWPQRSVVDFAGFAIVAAILLALLLPGLNRWRESTRQIACMDQLRNLGTRFTQYVTRDPLGRLPEIDPHGPTSFAGLYSVRLREAGLLEKPSLRWCADRDMPSADEFRVTDPTTIASLQTILTAEVNPLQEIQKSSGGHYAYTLGVRDGDKYGAPRFESRTSFAILSDTLGTPDDPSLGPHRGGINVLYEDGSVTSISTSDMNLLPDHPLQNHHGLFEAGLTIDDASLAPSWRPPFIDSRQR